MKRITLVILVFLNSCNGHREETYVDVAHEIQAASAKKIEQETPLRLIGTGGGLMDRVNMLALSFIYQGEVDEETSRELLVKCAQTLLNNVNSNKKIRPYLKDYPFGPKNIHITIYFRGLNDINIPDGKISTVSICNRDIIRWKSHNGPYELTILKTESYEDALRIVEAQKIQVKD